MPPFSRLFATLGVVALMPLAAQTPNASAPPVAPVKEHREVRHGETVIDNYFWLREKTDPEVVRYLEAEDAYTEAQTRSLKPFHRAPSDRSCCIRRKRSGRPNSSPWDRPGRCAIPTRSCW